MHAVQEGLRKAALLHELYGVLPKIPRGVVVAAQYGQPQGLQKLVLQQQLLRAR